MTVSIAQKVDLLYKQAFGVTKTDNETNKSPSNESIPSPLLLRGDTIWVDSSQIPATAAAVSGIVEAYTGASAIECVADTTTVPIGGVYPTWLTNLTNWIPQEFGASYVVQVWVDNPGAVNPTATGTQIFAAGSGSTGEYYFNPVSGVLNFIGQTIPAALTSSKALFIVGYRYIGTLGITGGGGGGNIGNLSITDTTISTATIDSNLILTANGNGIVVVDKDLQLNGNITIANLDFNDTTISTSTTDGNLILTANGNGVVIIDKDLYANANVVVVNNANIGNVETETIVANTVTIGTGLYAFSEMSVFAASTSNTDANQTIYAVSPSMVAGLDYVIVSTDDNSSSRQITKINAVIYDSDIAYNETSSMNAGLYLGDWTLTYSSANSGEVALNFTPATANFMLHKIMVTKYHV